MFGFLFDGYNQIVNNEKLIVERLGPLGTQMPRRRLLPLPAVQCAALRKPDWITRATLHPIAPLSTQTCRKSRAFRAAAPSEGPTCKESSVRRPSYRPPMATTSALELTGSLAHDPEPIDTAAQPLCFVFLVTGDEGVPQEVLCEGEAALEARELHRGDRVQLQCDLIRGLWRAVGVEVLERREDVGRGVPAFA